MSKTTLKMQLYDLTMQPNEDIACLVNKLKSIATQLSYVKSNIDEEDLVAILLKAVPEDPFEQIVTVLKEKDPSPSLEDVINSLQDHERKKEPKKKENGTYIISNAKMKCTGCGKTNHATHECFHLYPCSICGKKGHPASRCYQRKDATKSKDKGKGKVNLMEDNEVEEVFDHIFFVDEVY